MCDFILFICIILCFCSQDSNSPFRAFYVFNSFLVDRKTVLISRAETYLDPNLFMFFRRYVKKPTHPPLSYNALQHLMSETSD